MPITQKNDNTKVYRPQYFEPIKYQLKPNQFYGTRGTILTQPEEIYIKTNNRNKYQKSQYKRRSEQIKKQHEQNQKEEEALKQLSGFITFTTPSTYFGAPFQNNSKPLIEKIMSGEGTGNQVANVAIDLFTPSILVSKYLKTTKDLSGIKHSFGPKIDMKEFIKEHTSTPQAITRSKEALDRMDLIKQSLNRYYGDLSNENQKYLDRFLESILKANNISDDDLQRAKILYSGKYSGIYYPVKGGLNKRVRAYGEKMRQKEGINIPEDFRFDDGEIYYHIPIPQKDAKGNLYRLSDYTGIHYDNLGISYIRQPISMDDTFFQANKNIPSTQLHEAVSHKTDKFISDNVKQQYEDVYSKLPWYEIRATSNEVDNAMIKKYGPDYYDMINPDNQKFNSDAFNDAYNITRSINDYGKEIVDEGSYETLFRFLKTLPLPVTVGIIGGTAYGKQIND